MFLTRKISLWIFSAKILLTQTLCYTVYRLRSLAPHVCPTGHLRDCVLYKCKGLYKQRWSSPQEVIKVIMLSEVTNYPEYEILMEFSA